MSEVIPWKISVTSGLAAHFRQPNGPSRPGTDWIVELSDRNDQRKVIVRAYADETQMRSQEDEIASVIAFVAELLKEGWHPNQYQGAPGELTLPTPGAPVLVKPSDARSPWWRFW